MEKVEGLSKIALKFAFTHNTLLIFVDFITLPRWPDVK